MYKMEIEFTAGTDMGRIDWGVAEGWRIFPVLHTAADHAAVMKEIMLLSFPQTLGS